MKANYITLEELNRRVSTEEYNEAVEDLSEDLSYHYNPRKQKKMKDAK